MRGRRAATCACLLVLAGPVAAEAQTPTEPRIAYVGDDQLKQIRLDGRGREALTRLSGGLSARDPAWSPDGSALAYGVSDEATDDTRRSRLVLLDLATGATTTLAAGRAPSNPTFSPDGRLLAYSAHVQVEGDALTAELRLVGRDGSGARRILPVSRDRYDYEPAWSPDGTTIAFTRVRFTRRTNHAPEVWTVGADGGGARRLTTDGSSPAWSPDGARIAFVSTRDRNGEVCFHDCGSSGEIYVMDADGGDQRRLTRTRTSESSPSWSPDGSQVAFSDGRPDPEDNHELYAMRSDGSCVTRLTNTSVGNGSPAWRPGAAGRVPLVCGGAVPAARQGVFETDLSALRGRRAFPVAWLGPLYRGSFLSYASVSEFTTMIYDDCALIARRCPLAGLQVQTTSICDRDPLSYGGYLGPGEPDLSPHVTRYRRIGPALLADNPPDAELYTGSITVTLFGVSFARAPAVARRLSAYPGSRPLLSRRRFSARTRTRLLSVRRALRRHGMRELSRRWRLSPDQIRAALALRRELHDSELRGGARCRR